LKEDIDDSGLCQ